MMLPAVAAPRAPPRLLLVFLLLLLAAPVPPSSGAPGGARRDRGRFTLGKMRCTWAAREAEDAVELTVKCGGDGGKAGDAELRCVYEARPGMCPGFRSDPRGFWKQVGRAMRKLRGKVCTDAGALVKAGMCKRAPRDAHFKLRVSDPAANSTSGDPGVRAPPPGLTATASATTSTTSASTSSASATTVCTRRANHRKTAEEYCSSSWASVCTFFLSVLQSDDC